MDDRDLKRLQKWYRTVGPKQFARAAAGTLNAFAFGNRRESRAIIRSRMTVRNEKFILGDSSMRVIKSKPKGNINKMKSIFGSVERPRYTGLREQETGKAGPRDRLFTTAAREGNMGSVTKGWARLKPQGKYPSPNKPMNMNKTRDGRDFGLQGLSGAKRIVAFLMILNERKAATTFIIRRKFGRFKRGLYRFKQGVIKKLQSFDSKDRPKRIRWLTDGRRAFMTKPNILNAWATNIKFFMKKR